MSEFVPPSLAEVWEWKREDESECAGLSREELIAHYKHAADAFEGKMKLSLRSRPASKSESAIPDTTP